MSKFDFSDSDFQAMPQHKEMYLFFLKKGVDISVPHNIPDLLDFYRLYQRETGDFKLRAPAITTKVGKTIFTASEKNTFRPHYDVQISAHSNYCPVPPHAHEYFELLINAVGASRVYFGEEVVPLSVGDLLIIPPYVGHTNMVFSDDCHMLSMSVRLSTIRAHFPTLFLSKHILSRFFGGVYGTNVEPRCLIFHAHDYFLGDNLLADIYNEYKNPAEYSPELLNLLTSEFFFTLLRRYSSDAREMVFANSRPQIETLITQYIREHPNTVSLSELSRRFSYSERQISRLIRSSSGMSYSQLIRRIRMEAIGELVGGTQLPIDQIIADSGVSSPSYFYKTFRSYFGMTPREYRRRSQDKAQNTRNLAAARAE